jgi:hypothetical protein
VWETLPRVLNKYPRGSNAGKLEPHIRKSFLDLWAKLSALAGTGEAPPPAMLWCSAIIPESEPIRFKKRVMEAADGSPPVFQLMSVLRQTVENLRMYDDTQVDNDNVQEPRLRLRAMLPLPRWRKRCLGQPEQQKQQNKSASHLQVRYPHQIRYLQQRKKRSLGPTSASGNGIP